MWLLFVWGVRREIGTENNRYVHTHIDRLHAAHNLCMCLAPICSAHERSGKGGDLSNRVGIDWLKFGGGGDERRAELIEVAVFVFSAQPSLVKKVRETTRFQRWRLMVP
jgi:hypothetical protein